MNLIDETLFENDLPSNVTLDGEYSLDIKPTPSGRKCLNAKTDIVNGPFYFWFWKQFETLPNTNLRLQMTASVDTEIDSFGIGWQIIHNNQYAVMFARANFYRNTVEVINNTTPHIWTKYENIALSQFPKDYCKSFNIWLDCNPISFTYSQFGIQDNMTGVETVIPLSISNVPSTNTGINSYKIKINPKGVLGIQASARIDCIRVYEL